MWHRIKPALLLLLLTPLIAEYLSGSLSFALLPLFPLMVLMYGSGALLIREVTRRLNFGWPTILLLGIAYGVLEEGIATQSLFNPHYLGLRLLDRGFIPSLGIGGPWTIYVILLHVVWSIAVPIGLVEAIYSDRRPELDRRTAPWLRIPGLVTAAVTFVLGVALVTFGTFSKEQFVASPVQLAVAALIAILFAGLAFALPRSVQRPPELNKNRRTQFQPLLLGLLAFVTGSAFHLITQLGPAFLSPWVQMAIILSLPLIVFVVATRVSRSGVWTAAHTDALVLGGLAVYCWLGFLLAARLHGPTAIPGQLFPLAIALAAVYFGLIRRRSLAMTQ